MENDGIPSLIVDDKITKNCKDFEKVTKLDDDFSIVISNVTAKWAHDQNSNTLEKINLTVRPGQLLAVVGSVGAGKVNI